MENDINNKMHYHIKPNNSNVRILPAHFVIPLYKKLPFFTFLILFGGSY